jgi:putative ubiquitin-RnfH superfamily antitoxin RatB of RatAB toxin-antitoxin module
MITVQVIYALSLEQRVCSVEVPTGTTVAQAIALSDNARYMSADCTVARFGRPIALNAIVQDADRIEILRGLQVDPKEARRRRQAHRSRRLR